MKKYLYFFLITLLVVFVSTKYLTNEDSRDIRLGQSLAMSGPMSELGMQYHNGAKIYFDKINQSGGINNQKIELIVADDKYEPMLARKNVEKFIVEDGVFAIFGMVGTPTAQASLEFVLKNGVPFLMPFSGASFLYQKHPLIVNLRPSYDDEALEIIKHLKKDGISRVAIFYQNDEYGLAGLSSFKKALKESNIKMVAEGIYSRNTLLVDSAISEISDSNADAVLMAGAYKPSAEFINKLSIIKDGMSFYSLSFAGSDFLAKELKKDIKNVFATQVISNKLIKDGVYVEFLKNFESRFPSEQPTVVAFEGYLAASLFCMALQKSENRSASAIIEAFKRLDTKDLEPKQKGERERRSILDGVSISEYKNGLFEYR